MIQPVISFFTRKRVRNLGETHRLDTHNEENGVFIDAWYRI